MKFLAGGIAIHEVVINVSPCSARPHGIAEKLGKSISLRRYDLAATEPRRDDAPMLALDDSVWSDLTHAYGPAADVPDLLQSLTARDASNITGIWDALWSRLCHQGDVYSASYAAIPHIVALALKQDALVNHSFLSLPVAVEIGRCRGRGPELPPDLRDDYAYAISALAQAVARYADRLTDRSQVIAASAALAVSAQQIDLAEATLNLDEDWIARIIADDRR